MDPKSLLQINAYNLSFNYEQVFLYNLSFEIYSSRKTLMKFLSLF